MRLYHFTNAKFGIDDIVKRRLKVARIEDLNDPFETFAATLSDRDVRTAFQETRRNLSDAFGFLCFSERWQNPVQWSHYADSHRGVCLGFDIPERLTAKIAYSSRRIALTADTIRDVMNDDAFRLKAAMTKYSHWSYEKERRCVVELRSAIPEGNLFFIEFGDALGLREVIVGVRCALTRIGVADALGDLAPDVNVFQGPLAFRSFRIIRQRSAALWS